MCISSCLKCEHDLSSSFFHIYKSHSSPTSDHPLCLNPSDYWSRASHKQWTTFLLHLWDTWPAVTTGLTVSARNGDLELWIKQEKELLFFLYIESEEILLLFVDMWDASCYKFEDVIGHRSHSQKHWSIVGLMVIPAHWCSSGITLFFSCFSSPLLSFFFIYPQMYHSLKFIRTVFLF